MLKLHVFIRILLKNEINIFNSQEAKAYFIF